jgi:hypothetical protein
VSATALEIVRYRLKDGAEEEMLAERPNLFELLREEFPAMRSAHRAKLDDGTWIDIVVWNSREEAETAAREAVERPQIAAFFRHIDEVLSMEHAEVLTVEGAA